MECFECGADGSKVVLLDVLSPKGVVKLCSKCHKGSDLIVLRRPTTFQLKESEKKTSIYNGNYNVFQQGKRELGKTEENLKELVDRNYEKKFLGDRKPRPDLTDNFHWVIMRARRGKKLTQAQLAKEISESEVVISMVERGVLPEDDYRLINKLESFLGIKLSRPSVPEKLPEREAARILKFDESTVYNLTIDDLKDMKEEREGTFLGNLEEDDDVLHRLELFLDKQVLV